MFRRFGREKKPELLDEAIGRVVSEMGYTGPDTEEYPKLLSHLERLMKMRTNHGRRRVSPDTMMIVAGNLLGILIIVIYEQKHVMVSKGMNFILRSDKKNI